ncbi:MAG: hypothetical protein F7B95_03420, partial [Desulfurococcales archaeon]|nr:hypothetical protein [Desulfurococcales archaeon]
MHNILCQGTICRISLTALILALIIVQAITPLVLAGETQQDGNRVIITTWMLVPAVTKGSFGERGELINVTIQLSYPGSGTVNVVSGGGVSNSTRYSALTAIVTASVLLGVDWSTVDFNISFSTQNSISGPSGSFSIALAAYVLLNPILDPGKLHRYVVTGAIAPEGLAGRVGGVGVKCEAATRQGYVFVLPLSNIADLRGYECRDYVPVAGILEAVLRVYGVNMSASVLSPVYPKPLVDSMKRAAENMASYAVGNISLVEKLMSSNELPGSLSRYLSTLMAETRSYVELANEYKGRYPYSAASFAFRALVSALTARYLAEGYIKGEKGYFNERLDAIISLLESLKEELDAFNYTTLEQAEILSVAATRIADAEYAVEIARDYARAGNATNALEELAAADARVSSVISWMDSAKELEGSVPVTPGLLELLVDRASDFVGVNVQYASSILLEEGFTGHARVLRGILDKAERA